MTTLPMAVRIPSRFCPSKESLTVLNAGGWDASFSGGKDSTGLVTFIEALRRIGMVRVENPSLTMSDTGVEYPFLRETSDGVIECLKRSGWQCVIVRPAVHQKLYCQIFGRGLPPIHPGIRKTRWCTRSTKQDPIKSRFSEGDTPLRISGVRWGESDQRDGRLKATGCAVGGECGLPEPGDGIYSPIITWTTCKVVDWLSGNYDQELQAIMDDLLHWTRKLVEVYEFKKSGADLFGDAQRVESMLRFGCMGCPAIGTDKVLRTQHARKSPAMRNIGRIYGIWRELWRPKNRLVGYRKGKLVRGPIRMVARKQYFAELLSIQQDSGVELVTPDDVRFIRSCWRRKVYPRGWSHVDELNTEAATGLFAATNPEESK